MIRWACDLLVIQNSVKKYDRLNCYIGSQIRYIFILDSQSVMSLVCVIEEMFRGSFFILKVHTTTKK